MVWTIVKNHAFVGYISESSLNEIVGTIRQEWGRGIGQESVYNRLRTE